MNTNYFSRSMLWLREAVLLALLCVLIPSGINPPKALAHEPVQCGVGYPLGGNCYAFNRWPGHTYGARNHVWIQPFRCDNCNPSNAWHLNATLWVIDTTEVGPYGRAFLEVGYGGLYQSNGATWYYYANNRPNMPQQIVPIAAVPPEHYYTYSDIVITRNLQSYNRAKVGIYRGPEGQPPALYWATVTDTVMGDSTWLGNYYDIGLELRSGNPNIQSTQGWLDWRYMKWQSNDGYYHYQDNIGQGVFDEPFDHLTPYWDVYPWWSYAYGGVFATICDCGH